MGKSGADEFKPFVPTEREREQRRFDGEKPEGAK